jgi:hypothetical protein
VVSFTHRPLYARGRSPRYTLDRRLGGPHSRSGRRGEEKIIHPTGIRTLTLNLSDKFPKLRILAMCKSAFTNNIPYEAHNYVQLLCFWTLSNFFLNLKQEMFRKLDSVSVFRLNLHSLAQSIEQVPISGYQHQHKIGYINQEQHKSSARVKTNIKITKKIHTQEA